MQRPALKNSVAKYVSAIPETLFPEKLKDKATVMLSGSTGWGITEGSDMRADWDLHVLLEDKDYKAFTRSGQKPIIDDKKHSPAVFVQVRNKTWVLKRLQKNETAVLYLWIYTHGLFIQDNLKIKTLLAKQSANFKATLPDLRKAHHIQFSVRRLDTASCAARGLAVAADINRAEMVKLALQTFSLIKSQPYPYSKWLAKHVQKLSPGGARLIGLCEKCLFETDLAKIPKSAKAIRDFMEQAMEKAEGPNRWIHYWWEFNEN
ncbi:MAG: hypothetical protein Q8O74_05065 [bacterium]|nr:hypothetical protein [bacterium]